MKKHNVAIIGSGPAGYTAAIYTSRAMLGTTIFAGRLPGGLLTKTSTVENFPGFPEGIEGFDLMSAMQEQAEKFGAETDYDTIVSLEFDAVNGHRFTTADGREFRSRAMIIATGAVPRKLGVPGEDKLWGKGVSACATCDGAFFKDVPVVVTGGGDSAMEEAIFLTRFASEVHLVHRRESFRASAIMVERAKSNPKIKLHLNCVVEEIIGTSEVEAVRIKNNLSNENETIPAKGFFAALGHVPATELFSNAGVEVDDHGYIITSGKNSETNIPGVFAAGDCMDPRYRQAIIAAGNGARAALDAEKYLG